MYQKAQTPVEQRTQCYKLQTCFPREMIILKLSSHMTEEQTHKVNENYSFYVVTATKHRLKRCCSNKALDYCIHNIEDFLGISGFWWIYFPDDFGENVLLKASYGFWRLIWAIIAEFLGKGFIRTFRNTIVNFYTEGTYHLIRSKCASLK